MNKTQVPVENLSKDLYVIELDRPWLETPFLFQGFRITEEAELAQLRQYCSFVYIDPERSSASALMALAPLLGAEYPPKKSSTPRTPYPSSRPARAQYDDTAVTFGTAPRPDDRRFRKLVEKAQRERGQARGVIDEVMRDIRLGRSVDADDARELVKNLAGTIADNASASLWLTNLKNRDEYTSIHSLNVCIMAVAFGRHLGLARDDLYDLGLGALLHDIGKTRTPDEILNKPGKLTPEEFEIMKLHAQDGYEIMAATKSVPQKALETIRFHHERTSGLGYPLGLKGDQIPFFATITGLSDSYDAMTSDRCYKNGMTPTRALELLYNEASADSDRELVRQFISCIGMYPVGSLVELDTGALGIVVAPHIDVHLAPVVLLVRRPDGVPYEKRELLNLAVAGSDSDRKLGARIRRVLHPRDTDLDVRAIIAAEFRP